MFEIVTLLVSPAESYPRSETVFTDEDPDNFQEHNQPIHFN